MERSTRADSNTYTSEAFPDLRTCCGVVDRVQMAVIAQASGTHEVSWIKFLHPGDANPALCARSHALATGRLQDPRYRLRRADRIYRWFCVLSRPAQIATVAVVANRCGVQRIRSLLNRTSGEKVTPDLNKVSGQVFRRLHGDAARRRIVNPMEVINPVLDLSNRRFVRSARQSVDDVAVDIWDHGIGLGMGSAICRSIIGALDGSLWVPLQAGTVQ